MRGQGREGNLACLNFHGNILTAAAEKDGSQGCNYVEEAVLE